MSDSFLVVDETLETPPYRQIADQIRGAIERGELQPEMPLPTVRQLAGDLGIAPNTVARAYTELQNEGWLSSEGRRGTRVASKTPAVTGLDRARGLRESIDRFVETLRHRGFSAGEIARELANIAEP
ncbi:MAG TPA: GntR family transcriptional regulator [Candidatus Acidoferrales bacterium]|nr:GntR family transcriptional regulator [Candidatus Acidoferrales bacterium]